MHIIISRFYLNTTKSLQGKLYKFTCLPNGLCSGPRNFIKLNQEIEYLGFIINSVTMRERITTEKKRKIFDLC